MERIINTYLQATDQHKQDGKAWYASTRHYAHGLAKDYLITTEQASGVIAVLSPFVTWEQNQLDADKICKAFYNQDNMEYVSVAGFTQNKTKAINILTQNDLKQVKGPKVTAFYDNIVNEDSKRITLDRWMFRIYSGIFDPQDKTVNQFFQPAKYRKVEKDFLALADILGFKGYELQAILWLVARGKQNETEN